MADVDASHLANMILIVLRPEEPRPLVTGIFASELDQQRVRRWIVAKPDLLELLVRALRLAGGVDDTVDSIGEATGADGDEAWLDLRRRHELWRAPRDGAG